MTLLGYSLDGFPFDVSVTYFFIPLNPLCQSFSLSLRTFFCFSVALQFQRSNENLKEKADEPPSPYPSVWSSRSSWQRGCMRLCFYDSDASNARKANKIRYSWDSIRDRSFSSLLFSVVDENNRYKVRTFCILRGKMTLLVG